MDIIPVIDINDGLVVQVRRGGPQKYHSLESILVNTAEPVSVLKAFRENLGCNTFYIADLNVRHRIGDNFKIIREMGKVEGVSLLVEAGVNTARLAHSLLQMGSTKVVVGTKYLDSVEGTISILNAVGVDSVIFALEMERYQVCANSIDISRLRPIELICHLWNFGLREFIVIEQSVLGTAQGVQATLLRFLYDVIERCKGVKVITGGGIRDAQDIVTLRGIGVSGVLLGTALHTGTITADDIEHLLIGQF